jgi:putative PIN family toxin of toxin-antitoxin system
MRIVVDTNVIVSSILNYKGVPGRILSAVFTGNCILLFDTRIMQEYREVLHRPKFGFNSNIVDSVLDFLEEQGEFIVADPCAVKLPDINDISFLEVARSGRADALVTGNRKHFPVKLCKPIKICTPAEFIQKLHSS